LIIKLKKQQERQDDFLGSASQMEFDPDNADGRKNRGSTFLKMFRFDKARTPKHA